jgi:hypothetical protein
VSLDRRDDPGTGRMVSGRRLAGVEH